MRYFLIVLTATCWVSAARAQTAEDSVKTVVNNLFAAMKNTDPVLLKQCFADSMVLQTIAKTRDGKTMVRSEAASGFINVISQLQPGDADERISFDVVRIDGPLAIVWTPYQFYFKGKFSHCGVNSFQLVRFDGTWKIQYLIDTRRKDCGVN